MACKTQQQFQSPMIMTSFEHESAPPPSYDQMLAQERYMETSSSYLAPRPYSSTDNRDQKQQGSVTPRELSPIASQPEIRSRSRFTSSSQSHQLSPFSLSSRPSLSKPIVIPQVSKRLGVNMSPFARAYAPILADFDLSIEHFLTFLDGVNEAFIASPAFSLISAAGAITSTVPLATAQITGGSLQLTAGLGSAATSYARTKRYFKKANERIFAPRGLRVRMLGTKEVMALVGRNGQKLELPLARRNLNAMPEPESEESCDGAHHLRLRALEGHVQELTFDVPERVAPDNALKKMGDWHAGRLAQKQQSKSVKDQHKATRKERKELVKDAKDSGQLDKAKRKAYKKLIKVEKDIAKAEEDARDERKKIKNPAGSSKRDRGGEQKAREAEDEVALLKMKRKIIVEENGDFDRLEEMSRLGVDDDGAEGREERPVLQPRKSSWEKREQKKAQKIKWIVVIPKEDIDAWSEDDVIGSELEEREDLQQQKKA